VAEFVIDDEGSQNLKSDLQNSTMNSQSNTLSTDEKEKMMGEIQIYEKRIQGLIDGVGMLKERVNQQIRIDFFNIYINNLFQ
jgi:hypothetical protein